MLDKDIREPLFDYLDERYGRVRIIEEKIIGKSRADVIAIIKGLIIGFEIKSDNDTYTRLAGQIKDYDRYCDLNYVVVGERHIHVSDHVPDYWGIIYVNDENVIVERDASVSPKVRLNLQLSLLWRNELLNIQLKEGLPRLMGTRRSDIYKRLIDTAGEPTIKADMTLELMDRDYSLWNKQTVSIKKKRSSLSKASGDRSRAHVTNYISGKSSKGKRKVKK
ncbi:MAG: sce7726 family protein [Eubacterium sp.]|nr:sce7726 family protein [Eubacterium sp.]